MPTHNKKFSKYSDIQIKDFLEKEKNYKKVSLITGLSISVLRQRNFDNYHIQIRPWTSERLSLLIKQFPYYSDKDLSILLGLSTKTIQAKARGLKLKKDSKYMSSLLDRLSKNIASGSNRHQGIKGEKISQFSYFYGENHPNWKKDRSQIKGRRRKQFRFSILVERQVTKEQKGRCNICSNIVYDIKNFDHIIPVCIGGSSNIDNCQLLCSDCHNIKTLQEQQVSNNFNDLNSLKSLYHLI